jgi:hypothetical protein
MMTLMEYPLTTVVSDRIGPRWHPADGFTSLFIHQTQPSLAIVMYQNGEAMAVRMNESINLLVEGPNAKDAQVSSILLADIIHIVTPLRSVLIEYLLDSETSEATEEKRLGLLAVLRQIGVPGKQAAKIIMPKGLAYAR